MTKISFIKFLLVLIITIPSIFSLLNNQYFSMHDDQHIVRLYLLNQAIEQGYFYPRWVDFLGFGYGYPLFNFYPPLVYYIAESFHLIGFSLIWSIKLTFILGFFISALGIYIFIRRLIGMIPAYLSAVLYTYFFYHGVNIYVRGALAEFFSMAIIPFVFIFFHKLYAQMNLKNSVFFGISFSILILNHPLIAFPSLIYLLFFLIFYLLNLKDKRKLFLKYFAIGLLNGLALSAFFWLPSLIEKRFTLVDDILTKELANYKLHFVYLKQFWYSPWGYGGSQAGIYDGMSFQLGRIHIFLSLFTILLSVFYIFQIRKFESAIKYFYFFILILFFSLFLTTNFSAFIWDKITYLWYLQFPWRFLTFAGFFLSIAASFGIYFLEKILAKLTRDNKKISIIQKFITLLIIVLSFFVIFRYQKHFRPQNLINTSDYELTEFKEIAWRISRTSFEFAPKGVKTTKSSSNTTVLAINEGDLPKKAYEIISGKAKVNILENKFSQKNFLVQVYKPAVFRLNTFDFPGWTAYLNNKRIEISNNNDFKLITVNLPAGNYKLKFVFQNTNVRKVANLISISSFLLTLAFLIKKIKTDKSYFTS